MNKWFKITILLLLLLLLLPLLPLQALAAGDSVTAQIPFTVENAPGTVVIEADARTPDAPLPEQDTFENATEGKFQITFTETGDYYYKVCQKEDLQPGVGYDGTVYEVFVSVTLDGSDGLICEVSIYKTDSNYKNERAEFTNVTEYAYLDIEKVAKKGDREIEIVYQGAVFVYEIEVTNSGQRAAENVKIIDALPRELPLLEVVEINDDGVQSDDGKYITWTVDEIPSGGSVTLSFSVRVPEIWGEAKWINTTAAIYKGGSPDFYGPGGIEDTTVFDDWFGDDGMNGYFDTVTATATATSTATVTVPSPEVIVEKEQSLNGGERTKDIIDAEPGDSITYYITVTNNSDVAAADVIITDDIPASPMLILAEDSISNGGSSDGSAITWDLGELEPGQSETVSFTVTVPDVSGYTLWTNQISGSYTAGAASEDAIPIISNPVEARYETPPSPTPGTEEDPTSSTPDTPNATDLPSSSDTPGNNDPGIAGGSPQTGDDSRFGIWLILITGSFAGLIVFFFAERKARDRRV